MKALLTALLAFSCIVASFGQRSFGVKIYQNTDFFDAEITDTDTRTQTTVHNVNANRFSVALNLFSKRRVIHELELFIPEVSKSLDNMQYPMVYDLKKGSSISGKGTSYSVRYELSRTLTREDKRLKFSGGVGINPYYVHLEYLPLNTYTYYADSRLYGAAVNITPHLTFDLTPRFCLDLSVPIKVYDFRANEYQVRNPAIPIEQQISKNYSSIFFESAYTIRLGISYVFWKG
ncbi:MAG: hypothetical protein QM762_23180 [Chryseolinea sp.]